MDLSKDILPWGRTDDQEVLLSDWHWMALLEETQTALTLPSVTGWVETMEENSWVMYSSKCLKPFSPLAFQARNGCFPSFRVNQCS